ncbi:MAG: ankyrin repeat domain-containing protein [Vulcanimicrobiota bacterium]
MRILLLLLLLFTPALASELEEALNTDDTHRLARWLESHSLDEKDTYDHTPLIKAVSLSALKCVRLLLDRGASLEARNLYGEQPLHVAARLDHLDCLRMLLAAGAEVNAVDEQGHTPLHDAAWLGREEAVRILLAAGADADLLDVEGRLPLDLAAKDDRRAVYATLAAATHRRDQALAAMCLRRDLAQVKALLARGARPTPEAVAAACAWDSSQADTPIVILTSLGAVDLSPALPVAAGRGLAAEVSWLLARGARAQLAEAVEWAGVEGRVEVLELLLAAGGRPREARRVVAGLDAQVERLEARIAFAGRCRAYIRVDWEKQRKDELLAARPAVVRLLGLEK